MMWTKEDERKREIESAKAEITQAKALKVLLSNNTLAAEIHIAGMVMGVTDNKLLLPAVENQIKEITKYLNGKPNSWE